MEFGEKLKRLRLERGLLQRELAEVLQVSLRTIKNYELGHSYPKDEEVFHRLAEFFQIDVNYFLIRDIETMRDFNETKESFSSYFQSETILYLVVDFFSNSEISSTDKDKLMQQMQEIYWREKSNHRNK